MHPWRRFPPLLLMFPLMLVSSKQIFFLCKSFHHSLMLLARLRAFMCMCLIGFHMKTKQTPQPLNP